MNIVNGWNRLILSPGDILRLRTVVLCLVKASYTYPEAIYIPKSKSPDYHVPYYITNTKNNNYDSWKY